MMSPPASALTSTCSVSSPEAPKRSASVSIARMYRLSGAIPSLPAASSTSPAKTASTRVTEIAAASVSLGARPTSREREDTSAIIAAPNVTGHDCTRDGGSATRPPNRPMPPHRPID
jgi:hypothetical protein